MRNVIVVSCLVLAAVTVPAVACEEKAKAVPDSVVVTDEQPAAKEAGAGTYVQKSPVCNADSGCIPEVDPPVQQ